MTIPVSPDPSSMSTTELQAELEKHGEPTSVLIGRDELEFCVKTAREKNSFQASPDQVKAKDNKTSHVPSPQDNLTCPTATASTIQTANEHARPPSDHGFQESKIAGASFVLPSDERPRSDAGMVLGKAEHQLSGQYYATSAGNPNITSLRWHSQKHGMIKLTFDKSEGDFNEMFVAKKAAPFFCDPFNYLDFSRPELRCRISEEEWKRLDEEFLEVWNNHPASTMAIWKKRWVRVCSLLWMCLVLPYFIWKWLWSRETDRELAIATLVEKANKYILRPRGILMKRRIEFRRYRQHVDGYPDMDSMMTDGVFYLAIGREQIKTLEGLDLIDWDSYDALTDNLEEAYCSCYRSCFKYKKFHAITEESVGEDLALAQRWPIPSNLPV